MVHIGTRVCGYYSDLTKISIEIWILAFVDVCKTIPRIRILPRRRRRLAACAVFNLKIEPTASAIYYEHSTSLPHFDFLLGDYSISTMDWLLMLHEIMIGYSIFINNLHSHDRNTELFYGHLPNIVIFTYLFFYFYTFFNYFFIAILFLTYFQVFYCIYWFLQYFCYLY